jgi:hypothetical protein
MLSCIAVKGRMIALPLQGRRVVSIVLGGAFQGKLKDIAYIFLGGWYRFEEPKF